MLSILNNNKNAIICENSVDGIIDLHNFYLESTQRTGKWECISMIKYTSNSVPIYSNSISLLRSNSYNITEKIKIDTIKNIWYLPSENTWRELNLLAMRDIGILIFEKEELIFIGKKSKAIIIKNIQFVSIGKQGRDFINNWVKLEFLNDKGEKETAFFADGKMLGWSGILGGTKEIFNKINQLYK